MFILPFFFFFFFLRGEFRKYRDFSPFISLLPLLLFINTKSQHGESVLEFKIWNCGRWLKHGWFLWTIMHFSHVNVEMSGPGSGNVQLGDERVGIFTTLVRDIWSQGNSLGLLVNKRWQGGWSRPVLVVASALYTAISGKPRVREC